jgi:regulator of sirC expression with transglutaminase-like and TPR domain
MVSSVAISLPDALSESQRVALINLIADEDQRVYQAVREKILSSGPANVHWLKRYTLSNDPVVRRRVKDIVEHILRQGADNRFLSFCLTEGSDLNLEHGAWMLAQTRYPEISIEGYQAVLDDFAGELRERMPHGAGADQTFASFNKYFLEVLGFKGNEDNYYDPDNSYLNRVLDRRTGNPISLCLIYLLLGRRLNLPITGIGLPGHFICRFQTASEEFYIDVFNQGKLWTKANCLQYLIFRNYNLQEDYLAPVNSRRMLMRICGNLQQIYHQHGMAGDSTRMQRYLVALTK